MKKVKAGCKRFLCSLLLTVLLSNTVFHSYFGAVNCQAATAPALLYTSLMEMVMLSLGLSYSSTADLTAGGAALKEICESMADAYEIATDKTSPKWWGYKVAYQVAQAQAQGVTSAKGFNIILASDEFEFMRSTVYNLVKSNVSSSSDVSNPLFNKYFDDTVYYNWSEELLSYGLSFKRYSSFYKNLSTYYDSSGMNSGFMHSYLTNDYSTGMSYLLFVWKQNDSNTYANIFDGTDFKRYCIADGCYFDYDRFMLFQSDGTARWDYITDISSYTVDSALESFATEDAKHRLFINPSVPFYNSLPEYFAANFATFSSSIYGLSSSAKTYSADDEGNVSVTLTDTYFTAQVEQAVANALAENAEATDEELNAVVVDLMATAGEIQDSIGDLEDATQTEIGLLTSILSALTLLGTSMDELVNAISVSGDGTAILDWDEIDDAFAETEVTTGGSESDNDDDDNKPKPWVPGAIVTTGLLAPVISHFSEPLSIITQYLDSIGEWIMDIPESIADSLSTFDNPLDVLIEGVSTLEDDIFAGLPDIDIPSISNPLDRILEVLESMFVIDAGLIMDAIGENSLVWENKFSFLSRLSTIFNESVTPNYDYPVIKVQTPDILKFYYSDEYIILCDFKDFEVQCLWVRNLTRAFVWVAFALSVFRQFRVYFHVG